MGLLLFFSFFRVIVIVLVIVIVILRILVKLWDLVKIGGGLMFDNIVINVFYIGIEGWNIEVIFVFVK